MIKSIWSIGEDGSGLGYNVHLSNVAYDRVVAELSEEDVTIFLEEVHGGNIFVLEEDSCINWESVVEEAKSFSKPATAYEVLTKVKQVIAEHKEYE